MTQDIVERLRDWDEHDEGKINDARAEAADTIAALRAEVERLRPTRMCLSCGKTVPASHDRKDPGPDCKSPDACTFDLTHEEAWQWWSKVAHDERDLRIAAEAEVARLRAASDAHIEWLTAEKSSAEARADAAFAAGVEAAAKVVAKTPEWKFGNLWHRRDLETAIRALAAPAKGGE